MKKTITTILALLSLASTAFAATPAMDLTAGQTQIGYSYNSLQTKTSAFGDLGTLNGNAYQLAYGLSNKLAITGDYLSSNPKDFNVYTTNGYQTVNGIKFDSTAIGLQYKVNNNILVSVGSVKSELNSNLGSAPSTEMFGGIAYKEKISNNIESYASYLKSTNVQDWKAGLTYNFGNITSKGISYGINHKF